MYNGNYEVASLVYIYNVYVCSKTIFSPVVHTCRKVIIVNNLTMGLHPIALNMKTAK